MLVARDPNIRSRTYCCHYGVFGQTFRKLVRLPARSPWYTGSLTASEIQTGLVIRRHTLIKQFFYPSAFAKTFLLDFCYFFIRSRSYFSLSLSFPSLLRSIFGNLFLWLLYCAFGNREEKLFYSWLFIFCGISIGNRLQGSDGIFLTLNTISQFYPCKLSFFVIAVFSREVN